MFPPVHGYDAVGRACAFWSGVIVLSWRGFRFVWLPLIGWPSWSCSVRGFLGVVSLFVGLV